MQILEWTEKQTDFDNEFTHIVYLYTILHVLSSKLNLKHDNVLDESEYTELYIHIIYINNNNIMSSTKKKESGRISHFRTITNGEF